MAEEEEGISGPAEELKKQKASMECQQTLIFQLQVIRSTGSQTSKQERGSQREVTVVEAPSTLDGSERNAVMDPMPVETIINEDGDSKNNELIFVAHSTQVDANLGLNP